MTESSTAEATGGLTVEQTAKAFEAMMGPDEGTPEGETQDQQVQSEADDEPDSADEADEGADAEEQSDEDDEEASESEDQPQKLTVKVDGQEIEVTVDELKAGYSRLADYTRKTQEVAEQRKSLEAERQSFASEREQAKAVLEHWEQQLAQPLYDPAETEALRYTDPAEWAARKQEEADRIGQLQGITARKSQLTEQEAQQKHANHQRAIAATEQALLDAVPEWKADAAVAKKGLDQIWAYAATRNVTPQMVLADPSVEALLILRDAAAYHAIKSKRPSVEKKVEAVKAATPGSAKVASSKVTEVTRARQRLAKTGNIHDAARLFEISGLVPD
jgi:hypothetical protein